MMEESVINEPSVSETVRPNLPGMGNYSRHNSWSRRQIEDAGDFGKKGSISRPGSACGGKKFALHYNDYDDYEGGNVEGGEGGPSGLYSHNNRPTSAYATMASSQNRDVAQRNDNERERRRPKTATGRLSGDVVKLPKFVVYDKVVMRFYAFFYVERPWAKDGPLGNHSIETHMCRFVTIMVHVENDTFEINERFLFFSFIHSFLFFLVLFSLSFPFLFFSFLFF